MVLSIASIIISPFLLHIALYMVVGHGHGQAAANQPKPRPGGGQPSPSQQAAVGQPG
jgi:hypothetical protein